MNIEVGKYYKTRSGHKVRIYAIDGGGVYPLHGAIFFKNGWAISKWTENRGALYGNPGSLDDDDIVAEWIDKPEIDITALPRWANWYAMDGDSIWYWYQKRPDLGAGTWAGQLFGKIPKEYQPAWTGDWKDSLTEVKR